MANPTLRDDVRQALTECLRMPGMSALDRTAGTSALDELADALSRSLGQKIGGRYVPRSDYRPERDARVVEMWDKGVGREEVLRVSGISRRLYYLIIGQEQKRRQKVSQSK